jgi:RNA polymerase sigma factor (TIGR02999 family)
VHEAYLRLVEPDAQQRWESRGHFFAAAAEAMRRILIDCSRKRGAQKRGGGAAKVFAEAFLAEASISLDDLLDFDEALAGLQASDAQAARLVKLRVFTGLSVEEAAAVLGVPSRSAYRDWAFAKAWLFRELQPSDA